MTASHHYYEIVIYQSSELNEILTAKMHKMQVGYRDDM